MSRRRRKKPVEVNVWAQFRLVPLQPGVECEKFLSLLDSILGTVGVNFLAGRIKKKVTDEEASDGKWQMLADVVVESVTELHIVVVDFFSDEIDYSDDPRVYPMLLFKYRLDPEDDAWHLVMDKDALNDVPALLEARIRRPHTSKRGETSSIVHAAPAQLPDQDAVLDFDGLGTSYGGGYPCMTEPLIKLISKISDSDLMSAFVEKGRSGIAAIILRDLWKVVEAIDAVIRECGVRRSFNCLRTAINISQMILRMDGLSGLHVLGRSAAIGSMPKILRQALVAPDKLKSLLCSINSMLPGEASYTLLDKNDRIVWRDLIEGPLNETVMTNQNGNDFEFRKKICLDPIAPTVGLDRIGGSGPLGGCL